MNDMEKIFCSDCNSVLLNLEDRCNNCGSNKKTINLLFIDNMPEIRECLSFKCYKETRKKPILEVIQGDQIKRSTGEWVKKTREIDRKNDRYYEHVEGADGAHHCEEKLSKHRGHGSAKK
jgi:hypothetical protein